MGFGQVLANCFAKYATLPGRAHPPEYWRWALLMIFYGIAITIVALVPGAILNAAVATIVTVLLVLAIILPGCRSVRRVHDVDRSGRWYFIQFIPAIGPYWLLYFMVPPGTVRDSVPGPTNLATDSPNYPIAMKYGPLRLRRHCRRSKTIRVSPSTEIASRCPQ